MPLTYEISEQDGLVLAAVSGLLTVEDVLQFHEMLRADQSMRPGLGLLFDATLADPTTNFHDLRAAAADFRGLVDRGVDRVAIVAPEGLVSGLAHVYSIYADAEGFKAAVFESAGEARTWLNRD